VVDTPGGQQRLVTVEVPDGTGPLQVRSGQRLRDVLHDAVAQRIGMPKALPLDDLHVQIAGRRPSGTLEHDTPRH
jgi:hypothetical protein